MVCLQPNGHKFSWFVYNPMDYMDLARNEEFSEIAVIHIFLVLKKTSYLWGGGPAGKISR